jgi:hypothetical protein
MDQVGFVKSSLKNVLRYFPDKLSGTFFKEVLMKKFVWFLLGGLMVLSMAFMGCGEVPSSSYEFYQGLSREDIIKSAEESGQGSAPYFGWFECAPTVSTPPLPDKYDFPGQTGIAGIWVKKDWGVITPVPITIELYRVVDGFDVLVASKNTPDLDRVPALYYENGIPRFELTPVPGRHLYEFTTQDLGKLGTYDENTVFKIKEVVPENTPGFKYDYVLNLPEGVDKKAVLQDGKIVLTPDLERVEFATVGFSSGFYYIVRLQNVLVPVEEKTEISFTKTWVDDSNEKQIRPDELAFTLYAQAGDETTIIYEGAYTVDVVNKNGDLWTYTFSNLRKKTAGGVEITYVVKEAVPEGYTASYNGNNITNTIIPPTTPTPELPDIYGPPPYVNPGTPPTINLWVKKDWGSAANAPTQDKLTIEVYQDDKFYGNAQFFSSSVPALVYDASGKPSLSGPALPGRWLYQLLDLPVAASQAAYEAEEYYTYTVKEVLAGDIQSKYHLVLPESIDKATEIPLGSGSGEVQIWPDLDNTNPRQRVEWYNKEFYYIVRFQNVKN